MSINRLLLPFLLILFVGCSSQNKLATTFVTGTVNVDGQPMEDITVIFNPTAADASPAIGSTNRKGAFKLSTAGGATGKGAIPGSYIPTFAKYEVEQLESDSPEDYKQRYGNRIPQTFHLIPQKYANPKTCGMDPVTVEEGKKNHFEFALSTKE